MSQIAPRFNFTSGVAEPGVGGNHSTSRVVQNALAPIIFNEYERLLTELSVAVGDYDFSDIFPNSAANSVSAAIRQVYSLNVSTYNELLGTKLNISGGIITGNLQVNGNLVLDNNVLVNGTSSFDGKVYFINTAEFRSDTLFVSKIVSTSYIDIALDSYFRSNLVVSDTITAENIISNSLATLNSATITSSRITGNILIEGTQTVTGVSTFNNSVTFNGPTVFNGTFDINILSTFEKQVTFETDISVLGVATFEKPIKINAATSPSFIIPNTILVNNLNADKLDGYDASTIAAAGYIPVYNENSFLVGNITGTSSASRGNSATASKLLSPVKINGIDFDGSSDINISSFLNGLTVVGDVNLDGNLIITKNVYSSGEFWTSVSTGEAAMGVSFEFEGGPKSLYMYADNTRRGIYDSSDDINLIEKAWTDTVWIFHGDITGNADTATKFKNPIKINGQTVDGSVDVTIFKNVTDDAQVKKISSSIDGNLMSWHGTTGDTPADSGIPQGDAAYTVSVVINSGINATELSCLNNVNSNIQQQITDLLSKETNDISSLSSTISKNKTSAESAISSLSNTVSTNKTNTDTAISDLTTIVSNNKTLLDKKALAYAIVFG